MPSNIPVQYEYLRDERDINDEDISADPLPPTDSPEGNPFIRFIQNTPNRIPAFGILCALIGVTMFSFAALIVKLIKHMHAIEILIFRCIVQFIPYFVITIIKKYPFFGLPGQRLDLGLRCLTGTTSLVTLYMAYKMMPLSDASTLYMSSPVFVTIFAYFMLKEPITVVHVSTGTITIIGVFIICRPEFLFGSNNNTTNYNHRIIGIILSMVSAISSAFSLINLRKLKTTPVPVIVMWYSIACIVIGNIILPFLSPWVIPKDFKTWGLLLAIGLAGILNQLFQTMAFKYESPGPISVTRTFNIVLAFIWEVAIFVDPIAWTSFLGASLITSSIVIIAVNKMYKENPEKFKSFLKNWIFCCFYRKSRTGSEPKDCESVSEN